jgi:chromate reductase
MVELGQWPLSHQACDDSGDPPGSWTAFRQQVKTCDAVLFVTPAYNRSVPAPLTNAIDVGERNCKRHSLLKKGDAYDREEMNSLGKFCATDDISQSASTDAWRERSWQRT